MLFVNKPVAVNGFRWNALESVDRRSSNEFSTRSRGKSIYMFNMSTVGFTVRVPRVLYIDLVSSGVISLSYYNSYYSLLSS